MNTVIHPNPLLNFFYEKACCRVKQKYEDNGSPKLTSLHKNSKIIGNILKMKITANDNKYLITPTAKKVLLREKFFANATEMLWGSKEEIDGYIEPLFYLFWDTYVLNSDICEKIVSPYMYDYLPYAKHSIYKKQIIYQNNEDDKNFAEALFNTSKEELLDREESILSETMHFIYQKNQGWFRKEWENFTEETQIYAKLDKKLDKFAEKKFLPNITANTPTVSSSDGLLAKTLLERDLCVKDKEIKFWGYNDVDEHIKSQKFIAAFSYLEKLEETFKLQQQKDSL